MSVVVNLWLAARWGIERWRANRINSLMTENQELNRELVIENATLRMASSISAAVTTEETLQ